MANDAHFVETIDTSDLVDERRRIMMDFDIPAALSASGLRAQLKMMVELENTTIPARTRALIEALDKYIG